MQNFYLLVTVVLGVHTRSLPYVQDVFLQPGRNEEISTTTLFNITCEDCLCEAFNVQSGTPHAALNCFADQTCQLFPTFPASYKLQPSPTTRLYLLNGILPGSSRCCMPNITKLINQLKNATPIVIPLPFPATGFGYDENQPNEAAVITLYSGNVYWFNPINMTILRNQTTTFSVTIASYNHSLFTGHEYDPTVYISDEQTLVQSANITYPSLNQVRKFLFLNNGQTIIVPTQSNFSVTILDAQSPTQYTVQVRMLLTRLFISPLAAGNSMSINECSWCGESE